MTRLCDLTAAEVTWCIGGREYRLTPLRVADLGEIERAIDDGETDEKSQSFFTLEQLEQFLATRVGQELTFWHCLRRHQPNMPREAAGELLQQAREESHDVERIWQSLTGFPFHQSAIGNPHSAFSSIFHHLSLTYHWTPRQIGELTLPQLLAYLCEEPGERRTMWMSPAEARARRALSAKSPRAGTVRPRDGENADDLAGKELCDVPDESSEMPHQAGEALDQMARIMADVRLSLSRLERREDVAKYALPEEG